MLFFSSPILGIFWVGVIIPTNSVEAADVRIFIDPGHRGSHTVVTAIPFWWLLFGMAGVLLSSKTMRVTKDSNRRKNCKIVVGGIGYSIIAMIIQVGIIIYSMNFDLL